LVPPAFLSAGGKENEMMRTIATVTLIGVAATLIGVKPASAGSEGRKNTALAATALAVGAWSNHTGRAGRKNTAILATAGAAYAWTRYSAKKKEEKRAHYARVASANRGHHYGWYTHTKHGRHHA
jgi:hypothetical protein